MSTDNTVRAGEREELANELERRIAQAREQGVLRDQFDPYDEGLPYDQCSDCGSDWGEHDDDCAVALLERAALALRERVPASEDVMQRALRWVTGPDTGLSSECIWRTMLGVPESSSRFCGGSYPLDPADFGRCYRLLKLIPEWRPRVGEMAQHGEVWAALVARWDEIEAQYEREMHGDMAHDTYALMRSIRDPLEAS